MLNTFLHKKNSERISANCVKYIFTENNVTLIRITRYFISNRDTEQDDFSQSKVLHHGTNTNSNVM